MKRRLVRVVALMLGVLVGSAACASIPETSDPKPIKKVEQGNTSPALPAPPPGVDPFTLVRNFIDAAAAPDSDYIAARQHLNEPAQKTWRPPRELLIVDDVSTIPLPPVPGAPSTVQMVGVKATKVGRLRPDQSFVPEEGDFQIPVPVERQPDGQWRITAALPELVVSRSAFNERYLPVPVYFLNHNRDGVAPDMRYVVNEPRSAVPARVIDLLMSGPSEGSRDAVGSALPPGARTNTNVSEADDGALTVNFSDLRDPAHDTRRLIAAQVVLSLQSVSSARVRLLEDGAPLLPDQGDLRPSDVASYESDNAAHPELPGLIVVDERLRIMDQKAAPVPGPAGSGEYEVLRGAQSANGSQLAAIVRRPTGGVALRIGRYGGSLSEVPLPGADMSRPTWRGRSEVWTVVDGRQVVRVHDAGDGKWIPEPVNSDEFARHLPITSLRVSRDGTRVAAVVDGKAVIAGVSGDDARTALRRPVVLSSGPGQAMVTGVDWVSDDAVVAITNSNTAPVVEIGVDGFKRIPWASANLIQPLGAVTVAPGRRVVVSDSSGLWQATDQKQLWQLLPVPVGGGSVPFFPG